jgi:hypothetical protein
MPRSRLPDAVFLPEASPGRPGKTAVGGRIFIFELVIPSRSFSESRRQILAKLGISNGKSQIPDFDAFAFSAQVAMTAS